ncbi:RcnB family protein [Sphingomonas sp.]|uniref:RcnB family protein n=1 Tax=Sphingomonas sp. TaxID=28214 RepID=UPI003AFFE4D0
MNGDRPRGDWNRGPDRPRYVGGRTGGRPGGDWNRGWRDDRRYDWRGWRQDHGDHFRGPGYRAPYGYGYGYRRYGIGAVIAPAFFAQDYWIADPYSYRLPPAYGPYRWVRYFNDALLVDVYSGRVADRIPGFFW